MEDQREAVAIGQGAEEGGAEGGAEAAQAEGEAEEEAGYVNVVWEK